MSSEQSYHLKRKTTILRLNNDIQNLFQNGIIMRFELMKVHYLIKIKTTASSLHVLLSVPKKLYARANKRNRIKRQMFENLRLLKVPLEKILLEKNIALQLVFIYTARTIAPFQAVRKQMEYIFDVMKNKVEQHDAISSS